MELIKNFWNDESGQGLTEYAVIIGLVSVALLLVLIAFRDEIARVFNDARGQLQTAAPVQATT
jgi:pilus assembly protein Flp/PilA